MRPCTLEFVDARGRDEGRDGYEGRKTKVGDTGLRGRSVLDEDVTLRRHIVLANLTLARADVTADTGNVNSPLSGPHGQFHIRGDIVNLS